MKKSLLLFTTLILLFSVDVLYAQEFKFIFLGDDYMPYKGTLLRLNQAKTGFVYSFYKNLKDCNSTSPNRKVLYPTKSEKYTTDRTKLENRIFLIEDIIDKDGVSYTVETTSRYKKPIFILKDIDNGEIIYYKYDNEDRNRESFPFDVANLNLPDNFWGKRIKRKVDEFTDDVLLSSPPIYLYEPQVFKMNETCFIYLQVPYFFEDLDMFGVIVLFTDGTKWENKETPIKIEFLDDDEGIVKYSAMVELTNEDLDIFSEKTIHKYRLYKHARSIKKNIAEEVKEYIKCMRIKN